MRGAAWCSRSGAAREKVTCDHQKGIHVAVAPRILRLLAAAPNGSGLQRSRTPCSASLPSVEMSRANPLNQDSCWFQVREAVQTKGGTSRQGSPVPSCSRQSMKSRGEPVSGEARWSRTLRTMRSFMRARSSEKGLGAPGHPVQETRKDIPLGMGRTRGFWRSRQGVCERGSGWLGQGRGLEGLVLGRLVGDGGLCM